MNSLLARISFAIVIVVVIGVAGVAAAQSTPEASPGAPGSAAAADPTGARKACTDAMNADPQFAQSILLTVDKQLDVQTIAAHQAAQDHVERNERHVVLAYAAMWLIAAGFVAFLWRRQVALRGEIAQLRRDLEAAAKDSAK